MQTTKKITLPKKYIYIMRKNKTSIKYIYNNERLGTNNSLFILNI